LQWEKKRGAQEATPGKGAVGPAEDGPKLKALSLGGRLTAKIADWNFEGLRTRIRCGPGGAGCLLGRPATSPTLRRLPPRQAVCRLPEGGGGPPNAGIPIYSFPNAHCECIQLPPGEHAAGGYFGDDCARSAPYHKTCFFRSKSFMGWKLAAAWAGTPIPLNSG